MPPRNSKSLNRRIDAFLSGSAPEDPLYLTNRSWRQKVKIGSLIAFPILLLVALITAGAAYRLRSEQIGDQPIDTVSAPHRASAPHKYDAFDPIDLSNDLDVVDLRIERGGHAATVAGVVRNRTDRKIESAQVSYYLSDHAGNLIGTDSTQIHDLTSGGRAAFRVPLKHPTAEYAIARGVRVD